MTEAPSEDMNEAMNGILRGGSRQEVRSTEEVSAGTKGTGTEGTAGADMNALLRRGRGSSQPTEEGLASAVPPSE